MEAIPRMIDDPALEAQGFYGLRLPDRFRPMKRRAWLELPHTGELCAGNAALAITITLTQPGGDPVHLYVELEGHPLPAQTVWGYEQVYFPIPWGLAQELAGRARLRIELLCDREWPMNEQGQMAALVLYDAFLIDLSQEEVPERGELRQQVKLFAAGPELASRVLNAWRRETQTHANLPAAAPPLVLEVGAGQGWMTSLLALWLEAEVWGIDLRDYTHRNNGFNHELALRMERHRPWLDVHLPQLGGITPEHLRAACARCGFLTQNAERLALRDGLFSHVFSHNAFEHIMNPAAALAEIERTLRPGGEALLLSYLLYCCDGGSHLHATGHLDEPWPNLRFTREEIKQRIAAAGRPTHEVDRILDTLNGWRIGQFETLLHDSGLELVEIERSEGFTIAGAEKSAAFRQLRKHHARRDLTTIGFTAHLRKR